MKNIFSIFKILINKISFQNIKYKIIFLILAILIVSILVFLIGTISFQKSAALERMNNEAKNITISIGQVTAKDIFSGNYIMEN